MTEMTESGNAQTGGTIDQVLAEFLAEQDCGRAPDLSAFLEAHPDHAAELQAFFRAAGMIGGVGRDEAGQLSGGSGHIAGDLISERYRLVERLGEGGMGEVWLARQLEPVQRDVAIKLIRPGMDSRQILARFGAERQALAVMEHPNIARILDAGVTSAGRPFFVMEYLRGVPLTVWCDTARLNLRQRLELFVPVCQAIQHAHSRGILHRDLKPSNILVCLYDGQPIPRVIDFGLARAIAPDRADDALRTLHGEMVGTPLYMSPEQAEFNNLDIDTRTDVYSLGVILYELLTGTTPLERTQLQRAGLERMLQLIREEDPMTPSLRVSSGRHPASAAEHRSITPSRLQRLLRGELDWIVMRALEKDRSRRYETAAGLGRDIQRYLSSETVEAGPPGWSYRVRRFVKRHRSPLLMAAVCSFAAFIGLAGLRHGWTRSWLSAIQSRQYLTDRILTDIGRAKDEDEYSGELRLAFRAGVLGDPDLIRETDRREREAFSLWAMLPGMEASLAVLAAGMSADRSAVRLTRRSARVMLACSGADRARRTAAHTLLHDIQASAANSPVIRVSAGLLAIQDRSLQADVPGCVDLLLTALRKSHAAGITGFEQQQMLRELRLRLLWSLCRNREATSGGAECAAFRMLVESMTAEDLATTPTEENDFQNILESAPVRVATLAPDWFWNRCGAIPADAQFRAVPSGEAGFPLSRSAWLLVAEELPEEHLLKAVEACLSSLPAAHDDRLVRAAERLIQRIDGPATEPLAERLWKSIDTAVSGESGRLLFADVLPRCAGVLRHLLPRLPEAARQRSRGELLRLTVNETPECSRSTETRLAELLTLTLRTDGAEDVQRVSQDLADFLSQAKGNVPQHLRIITPSLKVLMPALPKAQVLEWRARLLKLVVQAASGTGPDLPLPPSAFAAVAAELPVEAVEEMARQLLELSGSKEFQRAVLPLIPGTITAVLPGLSDELKLEIGRRLRQAMPEFCSRDRAEYPDDAFEQFIGVLISLEQAGDEPAQLKFADSLFALLDAGGDRARKDLLAAAAFAAMPKLLADDRSMIAWDQAMRRVKQKPAPSAQLLASLTERLPNDVALRAWGDLLRLLDADFSIARRVGPPMHRLAERLPTDQVSAQLRNLLLIDAQRNMDCLEVEVFLALKPVFESLCTRLPDSERLENLEWIIQILKPAEGGTLLMLSCDLIARQCTELSRDEFRNLLFEQFLSAPEDRRYASLFRSVTAPKLETESASERWVQVCRLLKPDSSIATRNSCVLILSALAPFVDWENQGVLRTLRNPDWFDALLPDTQTIPESGSEDSEDPRLQIAIEELSDEVARLAEFMPAGVVREISATATRKWQATTAVRTVGLARLLSDRRELLDMLLNPRFSCAERQILQLRFEELVRYSGRRVLLPPEPWNWVFGDLDRTSPLFEQSV